MSGRIRTRIGWSVKAIKDLLEEEELVSTEEIAKADKEELLHILGVINHLTERMVTETNRIKSFNNEWTTLAQKDSAEIEEKKIYCKKYGNFEDVLKQGLQFLEELHQLHDIAKKRISGLDPGQEAEIESWEQLVSPDGKRASTPLPANNAHSTITHSSTPQITSVTATLTPVDTATLPSSMPTIIPTTVTHSTSTIPITHPTSIMPIQNTQMPIMPISKISLPTMQLPTFNGDITGFAEFTETFDSIMDYLQADAITRFHYLKSTLKGEPLDLIKGLPTVHQNYELARQLLSSSYGGSLRLKHTLLQQLRNLPAIHQTKSPKDLHQFCVNATRAFQQLVTLECQMDNMMTAAILESKLPKRILAKLYSNGSETPFCASELITRLHAISRTENLIDDIYASNHKEDRSLTTMSAVIKQKSNGHQQQEIRLNGKFNHAPCAFCASPKMTHRSQDCRQYKTRKDRKDRAISLKLCFRCLENGHSARICRMECQQCRGGHHESLCSGHHGNGNSGFFSNQPLTTSPGASHPANQQGSGPSHGTQHQHRQQWNQRPNHQQWIPSTPRHFVQQPTQQPTHGSQPQRFQPREGNHYQQKHGQSAMVSQLVGPIEEEQHQEWNSQDARVTSATYHVSHPDSENQQDTTKARNQEAQPQPEPVIMMTTNISVIDVNGTEKVATTFFDSGSNTSYISSKFTQGLQMDTIGKQKLTVNTFGSMESKKLDSRILRAVMKINNEPRPVKLCEVSHIANSIVSAPVTKEMVNSLLQGHQETLLRTRKEVDILIGMDLLMDILGTVKTIQLNNGLHLHLTQCGPIISGQEFQLQEANTFSIQQEEDVQQLTADKDTDTTKGVLESFWKMEHFGIVDQPKTKEEVDAEKFFKDTTTREADGRYTVRLPYRDQEPIPDNRHLAFFRLQGTLRRLKKDQKFLEQYNKIFEEQLESGFIELVKHEEQADGRVIHYLAHHPIIKESSKSTKVRIVFDGSARHKKNARSLNDSLHTGESLLPEIAGVMLRNRKPPILISADIQKAFLQLNLHLQDRDATRFLWIQPDGTIICFRYKMVPFGLKSSPFLLNSVIKEHLAKYDCQFAREMERSIYVDNVYVGVDTKEEAEQFYRTSKQIFADAKMNLCQYNCNNEHSNNFFEKMEKSRESEDQKLLGTQWNTRTDVIILQLPKMKTGIISKRTVLKTVASCYDPLGFLTPATLQGKLFFQELCRDNLPWDMPLSEDLHKQWTTIVNYWEGEPWTIQRQYFANNQLQQAQRIELHVFTDASKKAFGAVAYLRIINEKCSQSSFVMAKCRVAPLKPEHSIPQLELTGLLAGVKLTKYILKELDVSISQVYIWTDSMCVLDLVNSNNESSNKFIRNRIRLIEELKENFIFSHIPGELNPADIVSRGLTFEELKTSDKWIHGPQFLQKAESLPLRLSSQESRAVTMATTAEQEETMEPVIDPNRFSSFDRMLRTVMVILHFITKKMCTLQQHTTRARKIIYRTAQLLNKPSENCIDSLRLQLNLDGLWIYTGRVEEKPLIYLPHGKIAQLIIMDLHKRHMHSRSTYTLSRLRETFWLPNGRSYVNKVIKECTLCKKRNSKPYSQPPFAPFPKSRYITSRPFEHVGTDYAGPFNVTVADKVVKCYFIVFTCLYSRYTTVEIVLDMEAETFLHCLRRLAAVFGVPKNIVSDNAQQFVMMTKVMELVQNKERQLRINSLELPRFHQIPAHSPWAGGVYERMIGLIKESLKRIGITRQLLSLEDFKTILAECVSIVNMRPISYTAQDDDIKPLRPLDFVFPDSNLNHQLDIEPIDLDSLPRNHSELIENWSRASSLTDNFRRRWNIEYPQVLQERQEFLHRQKHATPKKPEVGEVVLIEKKDTDKNTWIMGRILETKPRSAIIMNGKTKRKGEYPFNKLFPLETEIFEKIEESKEEEKKDSSSAKNNTANNPSLPRRSPRLMSLPLLVALALLLPSVSALDINSSSTDADTISFLRETFSVVNRIVPPMAMMIFGTMTLKVLITVIMFGQRMMLGLVQCLLNCCYHKRKQRHQAIVTALCFFIILQFASGCTEIASFQAKDNVCVTREGNETCYLNTVSILNVRPNGSVACFNLMEETKILHSLEIKVEGIKSTCQSHTHFYARDFDLQHQYSHRCAGAGSCVSAKCSKTSLQDAIEELSLDSRKSPGFTECFEGCGCVTCGGCFRCDSSCLFNRVYATTRTRNVYEIFTCPSWTTMVDITVSLGSNVWKEELHHGVPYKIPKTNISVTITGFSTPPSPIHGATFIKANKEHNKNQIGYSHTSVAQSGYPSKGLIGELQCATKIDAANFNCQFDKSLCTCIGQGTYVDCLCKRISLEDIVRRTSLPRREATTTIREKDGQVTTTVATTAMVSLQLNFANQTIVRAAREGACKANAQDLRGCYGCSEGATAKLECFSDGPTMIAQLTCPSSISFLDCSKDGTINNVYIYTSTEEISWNCEVSCENGSATVHIEGKLLDKERFETEEYGSEREKRPISESIGEHLSNALGSIFGGILQWIASLSIGSMIIIVVVGFIVVQCLPRCLPRLPFPVGRRVSLRVKRNRFRY
ncbi:unnamed protein product [Caenorhabditis nigoni]